MNLEENNIPQTEGFFWAKLVTKRNTYPTELIKTYLEGGIRRFQYDGKLYSTNCLTSEWFFSEEIKEPKYIPALYEGQKWFYRGVTLSVIEDSYGEYALSILDSPDVLLEISGDTWWNYTAIRSWLSDNAELIV